MKEQANLNIDNYFISSYHADFKQQLSLLGLLNFLQESAWRHASKNNFGFYDLLDNGFFWALTRVKVVINDYPKWNENLRIETWSKEPDALIAYRDFDVFNEDNKLLVAASTAWLVVDVKTRRPQRMAAFRDSFPHLLTRHAIAEHPEKLPNMPDNSNGIEVQHIICASDMDMNGHVNNANYVRWVVDAFPFSFIETHDITELEVNFMRESKAGEQCIINLIEQADKQYLCNVVRTNDNCELARMSLKFKLSE